MATLPPSSPCLEFSGARLSVRLGWEPSERAKPQAVELAVRVIFERPPAACESDELGETVCYASLIDRARTVCAQRSFRLLEHLAWSLARELRGGLPADVRLELCVTKLHPPVAELEGGVRFCLSM